MPIIHGDWNKKKYFILLYTLHLNEVTKNKQENYLLIIFILKTHSYVRIIHIYILPSLLIWSQILVLHAEINQLYSDAPYVICTCLCTTPINTYKNITEHFSTNESENG